MKETGYIDFSDASATEVELSAQDLLSLPSVPETQIAVRPVEIAPVQKMAEETRAIMPPPKPTAAIPRARSFTFPRVAWGVGLAVVGSVVIAANHMYSKPERPVALPPMASSIPQQPDPVTDERPPTLVANPFDASEVFELPPDISEEEARDAVAEILLQRAAQRQALIGTRVPSGA